MSISKKIMMGLIIFVIFPLVVSAIVIQAAASGIIDNQTNTLIYQSLQQTRQSITNLVTETEHASTMLIVDPNIQAMSKAYSSGNKLAFESGKRSSYFSVNAMFKGKPYLHSVLISYNGNILFQMGNMVSRENTAFDRQVAALSGKVMWIPAYKLEHTIDSESNSQVLSMERVVNDMGLYNRHISYLRVSIDEAYFHEMFSAIQTWDDSVITMLDRSGTVISSTDRSLLNQNLNQFPSMKPITELTDGYARMRVHHQSQMVYTYRIEPQGWQIVQTVPVGNLQQEKLLINAFVGFAILLCVLFGFFLYIFQKKTIINPLRNLSREFSKLKRGQFQVSLPIKSKDEIGAISLSFLDMVRKLEHLIESEFASRVREKDAVLKALESQINPHFLYNTLDSIRWQAQNNHDHDVARQVEALGNLFRHVLNKGQSMTTIQEEVTYLQNYMLIQQSRFGGNVHFLIDVADELMPYAIPKLILQPLIENSLIHGIRRKKGSGTIKIVIRKLEEMIECTVSDDGAGMNKQAVLSEINQTEDTGKSLALKNVMNRLRYYYGHEDVLTIDSEIGKGSTVTVFFPAILPDHGNGDDAR